MSRLQDMMRKGGGRAVAERLSSLERHASVHNDIDEWMLRDLKDEAPAFNEAMETPFTYEMGGETKDYEPSADIRDDLFYTAHTPGESKVLDAEQVRPSRHFGRDVLEEFVKTEAHQQTKPFTESDRIAAAIYARAASEKFEEIMREQAKRLEEQQALAEQERQLGQLCNDPNATPGQIDALGQQIAQAAANQQQGLTPAQQQAIADAAQAGADKADAYGKLAGIDPAIAEYATPDEALALTEAFLAVPEFHELTHLIGRVSKDFRAQASRNVVGGDEDVTGVTTGANLPNVLPTELMQLGHPNFTRKFLKDFVDESLLEHETHGEERVANGPGVFCMDVSGSMTGDDILQAKAVAVAFIRLMHMSRRDAIVICFNSTVNAIYRFERRGHLNMQELLRLASQRASGGTSITAAIRAARSEIKKSAKFKKADVVIITDGGSGHGADDKAIFEDWRKNGIRTHGIHIGGADYLTDDHYLSVYCDDAIAAEHMLDAAGSIAANVR